MLLFVVLSFYRFLNCLSCGLRMLFVFPFSLTTPTTQRTTLTHNTTRLPPHLTPPTPHHTITPHTTAAAQSLFEAGRLPRYQDWKRAYREAKHCNTIVARAAKLRARQAQLAAVAGPAAAALAAAHMSDSDGNGGGEGGDDSSDSEGECDHRAAVAGRAAKQALAVNLKMPR